MDKETTIYKVRDAFRNPAATELAKTQMICLLVGLAVNLLTATILRALGWH